MNTGPSKSEFQEIAHCGGKIQVAFDPSDHSVSMQWSGSGPQGASMFQLGVALDGSDVQFWPITGVDSRPPPDPVPFVSVLLGSDIELMWGRSCPKCGVYFRTNQPSAIIRCPYCGHRDTNFAFSTKNQKVFIERVRQAWIRVIAERKDVVMDMDAVSASLPENRPDWAYTEERQQNRFKCAKCRTIYDILGEYAGCPTCGKRNDLEVFERHMTGVEAKPPVAEGDREADSELLSKTLSGFEGLGNDIRKQLALLPALPKRKNEIAKLSFQQIRAAQEKLRQWLGLDLFESLSPADITFLDLMVHRRHVFVHNSGRIDQKYLDATRDGTVRLNQVITVRSEEIRRLIRILRQCAKNLFAGYEAIT